MPPESVPSEMLSLSSQICRDKEIVEEEVWGGDSEQGEECDEIDTNEDGNEAIENCENGVEEPKEGMEFNTSNEAYLYYSRFAKEKGFAVAKRSSRKDKDGNLNWVILQCSKGGKARMRGSNPVKPRPQTKVDCPARLNVSLCPDGKWRLKRVVLEHNHEQSPGKSRFYKSNRVLDQHVKRTLDLNDKAGIRLHKTINSLQIQAGGLDKLPYLPKDCRNYLDKVRRLRLVEGDADAMHSYFMRMEADNSDFFYAMDLNEKGRLRNVFWADARSRAACKEFGDVVTFDTTYLVNKYDMPFAPFVGVNHHGQSILLGCGLISHEDMESFSWLFRTWMTCMGGCAPKAIITDQCMAMKNAIEDVFPNTRHRWCIWHIMKKVSEKLGGYKDHEKISSSMRKAVYNSLTIDAFEDAWDGFMKKYELQDNPWLAGMYQERKRWIPAYVKDCFWAGMASTQRSESMHAYFDGYITSKTTLKQFVEQYENALAKKVEQEKLEDMKSSNSYIPCITEDELEKQFQSAYTNEKFIEFHTQFVGKINCSLEQTKEGDVLSEYEVKEKITFGGEGEEKIRKSVPFIVKFNAETNETHCNCRMFESRGMLCKHQLLVYHKREIERVPDKYVLRRWSKNVKRVHTKIRINYDNSTTSIERHRHDNMCNLFNEVADLAEDSQEKYDMVMRRVRELKQELVEEPVVLGGSNTVPDNQNVSLSLGDGVLPPKQIMTILDPEPRRRKGRPPSKRKQGVMEKVVKKKIATKKKILSKENTKEVEEVAVAEVFGTQESVANFSSYQRYTGPVMLPNMMVHNMRPNMAQGGSILPFSPTFWPTEAGFNQFMNNFPSSQSNASSLLNSQVWRGQSTITGAQVWGGESSLMENQGHDWGGGHQSFTEMMHARDNGEE